MTASFPRPELLASTDWLAENLGRPGVRVVDCRWRPDGTAGELFAAGHVEGAARLDWVADLLDPDSAVPFQLGGPERVAATAGRAGIGDGSVAVLYDDTAALYAARVWWSLRAYGFTSARILDGGYRRWQESGLPVASGAGDVAPAVFTPRAEMRMRVSAVEVRTALGDGRSHIVDARSPAEYRGQEGHAARLGHIPQAVNLPAVLLTVPGSGDFRRAAELQRLVNAAGVTRGRRVIAYDTTGVGAAKLAFALALLGFEDVGVYDGGWAEWGERTDLPIAR